MIRVGRSGGEIGPEVVEACRRGDREALRALYEAYKERVYSIALYFFHGDAAAAGDVTQQVFLKLIDSIGRYRGDAAFGTWLYRIVTNVCVDRTRGRRLLAVDVAVETLERLADPSVSLEDQFARREVAASVQDAIAALPPKLRLAILLRYFDDLSYGDMAAALNCSIGTVSSRLSRAHRLLAKRLEPLRAAMPKG